MFRAYGSHDRTSHIDGWTEVQPYKIGRAYGSFRVWPLDKQTNLSNHLNHSLFLPTF